MFTWGPLRAAQECPPRPGPGPLARWSHAADRLPRWSLFPQYWEEGTGSCEDPSAGTEGRARCTGGAEISFGYRMISKAAC